MKCYKFRIRRTIKAEDVIAVEAETEEEAALMALEAFEIDDYEIVDEEIDLEGVRDAE